MTREELKKLSDDTFYDNNVGGISPDSHRTFNNSLIDSIPETAGGDLTGKYPNPTIGNLKVTSAKLGTGAVTEAKLSNSAVTESKIANGAVGNSKLKDGAVTQDKLAANLANLIKAAYVVQLDVPLASYMSGLRTIIRQDADGDSFGWIAGLLDQGYSSLIIRGTDNATMTSLRITINKPGDIDASANVIFITSSAVGQITPKVNLVLSRIRFYPDDQGGMEESKLTLGQL